MLLNFSMRLVFLLPILILLLINPISAFCSDGELREITRNYGRTTNYDFSALRAASRVSAKTFEGVGHQGQALLLIMMLSGVDLVKQNLEKARIEKGNVDAAQLRTQIAQASSQILQSGEIWSSLIGASITMGISSKPVQIINQMIENSKSKRLLKNLLQSGIATLITFVGWEIGGQLYSEAIHLLEDPNEFKRSKKLMPLLLNSLKVGTFSSSPQHKEDLILLQKIFSNIMAILVYDHDLRNLWLYNAWRMKIATGEFVTLVSSMVGASAVGTYLFPGAGTLAGLMFGLAGGVLSLFIPENIKEGITEKIQYGREVFLWLGSDEGPLFDVHNDVLEIAHKNLTRGKPLPPLLPFPNDSQNSELLINILIERLFKCESRIDVLSGNITLAHLANNKNELDGFKKELDALSKIRHETAEKLNQLYFLKERRFGQLLNKFPVLDFNTADNHANFLEDIQKRKGSLPKLRRFFDMLSLSILGVEGNSKDRDYMETLYRFYFFGFSESQLLSAMDNNSATSN